MSLCERCQAEINVELPAAPWIEPDRYRVGGQYLPPLQWQIFCILWRRFEKFVPVESFMALLYGDRADPPYDKIIVVRICQLRQVLEATPCEIVTRYGGGYALFRKGEVDQPRDRRRRSQREDPPVSERP